MNCEFELYRTTDDGGVKIYACRVCRLSLRIKGETPPEHACNPEGSRLPQPVKPPRPKAKRRPPTPAPRAVRKPSERKPKKPPREIILDYLRDHPGSTIGEIVSSCSGCKDRLYDAVRDLVKSGEIRREGENPPIYFGVF